MKAIWAGALVLAMAAGGTAEAKDKTAAILGGVAVGAIGGAVLGSVLTNHAQAQPQPVYLQPPPPPPQTVVVEEPRPVIRRVVVEEPRPVVRTVVTSPYDDEAFGLKEACDNGSKRACIRFGIMIGKHRERVATWRRTHPDFFSYED